MTFHSALAHISVSVRVCACVCVCGCGDAKYVGVCALVCFLWLVEWSYSSLRLALSVATAFVFSSSFVPLKRWHSGHCAGFVLSLLLWLGIFWRCCCFHSCGNSEQNAASIFFALRFFAAAFHCWAIVRFS